MKVPIDFNEMYDAQLLSLARRCVREYNDQNIFKFKVVRR